MKKVSGTYSELGGYSFKANTVRVDSGFILVRGWQLKYEPTPERRAWALSKKD